jgi:dTDP-4-amino-4,6-dideoxygalactose transaminase
VFCRLNQEIAMQGQRAAFYATALKGIRGIKIIDRLPDTKATYPYLTLVFDEMQKCQAGRKVLEYCGLGIAQIYACAITDYEYLKPIIPYRDCPNARSLARREITLSTSTFLTDKELELVVTKIKKL